jgi:NADPH:quinone reductase-like Zn-dependent oxidoreductase
MEKMKAVVYDKKPVIDRRYPLDKASEAMEYLNKGHAKGKVVVLVE